MKRLDALRLFSAFFLLVGPASAAPALFALSPDNSLPFIMKAIGTAKRELVINIYEFEERLIREALIERIHAGVAVKILIEGQPFSGLTPSGRATLEALLQAMKQKPNEGHALRVMGHPLPGRKRRFVYNHAKYMVVDRSSFYVSTENFNGSNYPSPGRVGNRGWHVWMQDADVASKLLQLHAADASTVIGDVHDSLATGWLPPAVTSEDEKEPPARSAPALPGGSGNVGRAALLVAPGAANELVALIGSARQKVALQFMSLPARWWMAPRREYAPNPIAQALLDRAEARVPVRVLLNDDVAFRPKPGARLQNLETVCLLLERARERRLPLEARLVDTAAAGISYIHNKGILLDSDRVLVSSINGTQNSVTNNRELGVVLQSPAASQYYGRAFEFDWSKARVPTAEHCKNPVAP